MGSIRQCGEGIRVSGDSGASWRGTVGYGGNNMSPEERFWSKVEKSESCWMWKGKTNNSGYGSICGTSSHRFSWALFRGRIPEGMRVLHVCDIRKCVNPDHLFLGTQLQNILDAKQKGRLATGDRHRSRTHPHTTMSIREQLIESETAPNGILLLRPFIQLTIS